jgi:hypothetical protein
MKPKDKSEELLNKIMASTENAKLSDYSQIYSPTAKKIALLMVDEIINSVVITDLIIAENQFKYWEKVKTEINKL